jgi:ferredoxin/flavodoxin
MIVYYTGTGNSRRAAQLLADRLQDEIFDVFPCLKENRPLALRSERPWIFVAPTYGWQLPHVFRDLILNGDLQGSCDAYFVMTCGAGVGNAEKYLRQLCDKKGLTFKGLQPLVMPENYIAMFPVPDERAGRVIVKKADKRLERAVPLMAQGLQLPVVKANPAGKAMSSLVNTVFTRGVVTAKPFRTTDQCIGCGKCVQMCPRNNITLDNGRPKWSAECIHCMACISHCPTEAIEYGKKSVGKPRWQCPEWEETK